MRLRIRRQQPAVLGTDHAYRSTADAADPAVPAEPSSLPATLAPAIDVLPERRPRRGRAGRRHQADRAEDLALPPAVSSPVPLPQGSLHQVPLSQESSPEEGWAAPPAAPAWAGPGNFAATPERYVAPDPEPHDAAPSRPVQEAPEAGEDLFLLPSAHWGEPSYGSGPLASAALSELTRMSSDQGE